MLHTGLRRTKPFTPSTSSPSVADMRQPCTPSLGTHPLAGSTILVKSSLCPYDSNRSASSIARKDRLVRETELFCNSCTSRLGVETMMSGLSFRIILNVSLDQSCHA